MRRNVAVFLMVAVSIILLSSRISHGGYNTSKCKSNLMKNTGKYFKGYMGCWIGYMDAYETDRGDNEFDRCEEKQYDKFEKKWSKEKAKAAKKGVDCTTDTFDDVEGTVYDAADEIFDGIETSVDESLGEEWLDESKTGRTLVQDLLKAAQDKGDGFFKAYKKHIKKPDENKLAQKLAQATAQFEEAWEAAKAKATSAGNPVIYVDLCEGCGASGEDITMMEFVEGLIDSMIDEAVAGMQLE